MTPLLRIVALVAVANIAAPSVAAAKAKPKSHSKGASAGASKNRPASNISPAMDENRKAMIKKSKENKESGGKT